MQTYPKVALLLDSCFTEAGFTLILQSKPEPSSPPAIHGGTHRIFF